MTDDALFEHPGRPEHPGGSSTSSPPPFPEQQPPRYTPTQQQQQQHHHPHRTSLDPRNDRIPSETTTTSNTTPTQEAVKSPSPPPICSVLTWDNSTPAGHNEGHQHPETNYERKDLATSKDLQDAITNLIIQHDTPLATATSSSSFVTTTGHAQQQQQQQQQDKDLQQYKPLIILHGLPAPFVSALLESPLDIDPAFIAAHAEGRRYRPRGAYRRRTGGSTAPAHWDYPELVAGYRQAVRQQGECYPGRRRHHESDAVDVLGPGRPPVWPVSGVHRDLAVVFYRASLWCTERVDVLFLDEPVWRGPETPLRKTCGRRNATRAGCAPVRREGVRQGGGNGGRWRVDPREKDWEMASLEDVLQETVGSGEVDGGLEGALEEAAYGHWLDFFEVLTPGRKAIPDDRMSLEWRVMEALERNTDMRKDIARRRKTRENYPDPGPYADWEDLTHRLRLRVDILATMPPHPKPNLNKIPIHEDNLARLPVPRRATPNDANAQPSPGSDEDQRSLDRVTYLGGVLLPFSIVSGVLSMNDDFQPGSSLFWVFWVAAVPLAVFTLMLIYADKLRRAEVWVAVSMKGEEGGSEGESVGGGKEDEKVGAGPVPVPSFSTPIISMPERRAYLGQPETVAYSAGGDVVIDLGTPTTATAGRPHSPSPLSLDTPPTPPQASPRPGDEQDLVEHLTDEEEEEEEEEEEDEEEEEESSDESAEAPVVEEIDPNIVIDGSHRHRAWRKKQLGWTGAVMCILKLQNPSMVSEGVPAGATRIVRRRRRRESIG
ncbi:hypothetical protein VM1G_03338 [Cytospora mali]|uniref:Uncharacterized protein n=1 Tax=Cytospora mali TaxID=578113 RepID=A0A194VUZ4_CYTMA|nr:hypothetical protein VM1G_03338 [Valsa mali]